MNYFCKVNNYPNGEFFDEIIPERAPIGWSVSSVGDFNGDLYSDILWRMPDGTVALWLMDGLQGTTNVNLGIVGQDWQIAGTADFNGDRYTDILWRNMDGTVVVWLMNQQGQVSLTEEAGRPGQDWQIQKTGDFNGDRNGDILWRNIDGTLAIWFMYGGFRFAQSNVMDVADDWVVTDVLNSGHD